METPPPQKLERAEIEAFLTANPAWAEQNGALVRTYELTSFAACIAFVVTIGFAAEKLDHHPDLGIAYNKVSVLLITHDANGLTQLDLALATKIDKLHLAAPARSATR